MMLLRRSNSIECEKNNINKTKTSTRWFSCKPEEVLADVFLTQFCDFRSEKRWRPQSKTKWLPVASFFATAAGGWVTAVSRTTLSTFLSTRGLLLHVRWRILLRTHRQAFPSVLRLSRFDRLESFVLFFLLSRRHLESGCKSSHASM